MPNVKHKTTKYQVPKSSDGGQQVSFLKILPPGKVITFNCLVATEPHS